MKSKTQPTDMKEAEAESGPASGHGRVFRVGCALLPKKVARYYTSAVRKVARLKGIKLELLDPARSLLDQGEYDAIVHKLRPNTGEPGCPFAVTSRFVGEELPAISAFSLRVRAVAGASLWDSVLLL